jgi:hypothetical protein
VSAISFVLSIYVDANVKKLGRNELTQFQT